MTLHWTDIDIKKLNTLGVESLELLLDDKSVRVICDVR